MNLPELYNYLKNIPNEYYEFSFYKNSSEIMEAVNSKGLQNVMEIKDFKETNKGVFECTTQWKINDENSINKKVTIDITGEMIFITEYI